jgi:hypothetical protein
MCCKLCVSACGIKCPLRLRHGTQGKPYTGFSGCGASQQESGLRVVVASASTPPDVAAGPPQFLDNARSFTEFVCVSHRACLLLWNVRPPTAPGVLQAHTKVGGPPSGLIKATTEETAVQPAQGPHL